MRRKSENGWMSWDGKLLDFYEIEHGAKRPASRSAMKAHACLYGQAALSLVTKQEKK